MSWDARVAERDEQSLGAVAVDRAQRIICVSDGVIASSGLKREDLIGRKAVELVHPDDLERAKAVLQEVQSIPGERPEGLYRLRLGDGTFRRFTIRATNLGAEDDDTVVLEFREPTREVRAQAFADDVVDIMRMLSENVTLEEAFEWVSQIAERHVEDLQIVITTFDDDGPNQLFSRHPVPDSIADVNHAAQPDALPLHVEVAHNELAKGPWRASQKIAALDFIVPGRLTSILAGRDGQIVGYVEALRGTTEAPDDAEWLVHGMISRMMTAALYRYEFDRQLRRAADLDPLTGLLNRRRLFELLNDAESLEGSWLYLIDLDRFSWVNNNLGHQTGDETLIAIADALVSVCPENAVIARLGGDEFVVWIAAEHAVGDISALGSALSDSMVVPVGSEDRRVLVRGSIGMVQAKPDEPAADALNRADAAMYVSKRSGGDSATLG